MPKKKKKKIAKRKQNGAPSASDSVALDANSSTESQTAVPAQVVEAEFGEPATKAAAPAATAAAATAAAPPPKPSPISFLQGSREELSKVVWPDRQQLISESAAVILMVSFLAVLISFIDNLFSWASKLVF